MSKVTSRDSPPGEDEFVTLMHFIKGIQVYSQYILRKKILLVFFIVLGTLLSFFLWTKSEMVYSAKLTFMVNEGEDASGGRVSSILNTFGFGGISGGGSKANPQRILEIAKSSIIIHPTVLDSVMKGGKHDILANFILESTDLVEQWSNRKNNLPEIQTTFRFNNIRENFGLSESWALRELVNYIIGDENYTGILKTSIDDDTGLMDIEVTSTSEEISFLVNRILYDNLSHYYIEKTIEPQRTTLTMVQEKSDSLRREIDKNSRAIASIRDSQKGMLTASSRIMRDNYSRDLQIATIAYGKALENQELAAFSLSTQTPYFQITDEPFIPLKSERPSVFWYTTTGAILGLISGIMLILLMSLISVIKATTASYDHN